MTCIWIAVAWIAPARANERPPDLHFGAPIIPWAKSVGEDRFRSPRNYEDTLLYYRKVLKGNWQVSFRKIINVAGTRAHHIENTKKSSAWEGLNVYEHKGATFIFAVFSEEELARRAKAGAGKKKERPGRKSKPGSR